MSGFFQDFNRVSMSGVGALVLAGAMSLSAGNVFAAADTIGPDSILAGQSAPKVKSAPVVTAPPVLPPNVLPSTAIDREEFENYIVRLNGRINADVATKLNAQLLYLDRHNPDKKDITLIIQSPGGEVMAGLSIFDTLKSLKSDVRTVCSGYCASMGAFLLTTGGTPGKRSVMPNASLMYHQLSAGCSGKGTDISICNDNLQGLKGRMLSIMVDYTGLPRDQLRDAIERDWPISLEEAKEFGFIDSIEQPVHGKPDNIPQREIRPEVMQRIRGYSLS